MYIQHVLQLNNTQEGQRLDYIPFSFQELRALRSQEYDQATKGSKDHPWGGTKVKLENREEHPGLSWIQGEG